jgi:hypothetical protein
MQPARGFGECGRQEPLEFAIAICSATRYLAALPCEGHDRAEMTYDYR